MLDHALGVDSVLVVLVAVVAVVALLVDLPLLVLAPALDLDLLLVVAPCVALLGDRRDRGEYLISLISPGDFGDRRDR